MDITDTLAPKSDQLDAVDLVGGPRIFTVTGVSRGNPDQPVQVALAEFDRVWRPGKSMRRVLGAAWGTDASQWAGRRIELYCDADVMFGGEKVGGVRISRMSHIDKPLRVPLLIKRGKSGIFTVQPLPDAPAAPSVADRARQAVGAFERYGVTQTDLEQRVGKPLTEWVAADLDELTAYFKTMSAPTEAGEQP